MRDDDLQKRLSLSCSFHRNIVSMKEPPQTFLRPITCGWVSTVCAQNLHMKGYQLLDVESSFAYFSNVDVYSMKWISKYYEYILPCPPNRMPVGMI